MQALLEDLLKLVCAKQVATLNDALQYTPAQLIFLLDAKLESEAVERIAFCCDLTASIACQLTEKGNKAFKTHIETLQDLAKQKRT